MDTKYTIDDLNKATAEVASGNKSMTSNSSASKDNVEENSGVDFPGQQLEQYIGTTLSFEDKSYVNELIVIEVASSNK